MLCSSPKVKTGIVFPTFCQATFHHALIMCWLMYTERGTIAWMYHNWDTFDFSQGHVGRVSFPVGLYEVRPQYEMKHTLPTP